MTRQLVRDLMTVGVETCSPDTPIADLARALLDNSGEDLVVMEDGHALGTIGLEQMTQVYAMGDYSDSQSQGYPSRRRSSKYHRIFLWLRQHKSC